MKLLATQKIPTPIEIEYNEKTGEVKVPGYVAWSMCTFSKEYTQREVYLSVIQNVHRHLPHIAISAI